MVFHGEDGVSRCMCVCVYVLICVCGRIKNLGGVCVCISISFYLSFSLSNIYTIPGMKISQVVQWFARNCLNNLKRRWGEESPHTPPNTYYDDNLQVLRKEERIKEGLICIYLYVY